MHVNNVDDRIPPVQFAVLHSGQTARHVALRYCEDKESLCDSPMLTPVKHVSVAASIGLQQSVWPDAE